MLVCQHRLWATDLSVISRFGEPDVSICAPMCLKDNENVGNGAWGVVFSRFLMTVKLEDPLGGAIRLKHFSRKTEETYVGWYRRYDGALPRHPSG